MTHRRSGGVAVRAESHLHVSFFFHGNGRFSQSVTFTSPSVIAEEESLQVFGLTVYHSAAECCMSSHTHTETHIKDVEVLLAASAWDGMSGSLWVLDPHPVQSCSF